MATTYLSRTLGTPTLATKATCSLWFKRSKPDENGSIIFGNSNGGGIFLSSNNSMYVYNNDSSFLQTNRLFRDVNAWYHVVYSVDTTQSTASDRVKLYINGVQETSFASSSYPNQNSASLLGTATEHNIGRNNSGSNFFNGSMSHVHFIDGTAYDASAFGETDANGVWTIKISPSVTYGNNGFFILKDGNSVTDQSGNGNNFTVAGGTLTNTEDNPSNVFATLNPLWSLDNEGSYSNGNTTWSSSSSNAWYQGMGTLAFSSGKYYWEVKVTGSTNVDKSTIGICGVDAGVQTGQLQDKTPSVFFKNEDGGEMRVNAVTGTDDYGTFAQNDIMGIAVDMDSLTMSLYKNGTILVNAHDISGIGSGSVMTPATMHYNQNTHQYNFGNGYFGTTAVASAGTNASGIGIFEYDVPTGYTALSTKGLNL